MSLEFKFFNELICQTNIWKLIFSRIFFFKSKILSLVFFKKKVLSNRPGFSKILQNLDKFRWRKEHSEYRVETFSLQKGFPRENKKIPTNNF